MNATYNHYRLKHDDSECDCEGDVEDAGDWHAYALFANDQDEAGDLQSAQIKASKEAADALVAALRSLQSR